MNSDTAYYDPYAEYGDEEEEEMPATERELAEDAQWKVIQKNTFTRWANEHLKTVNKHIADLEVDFGDGLRLIALVEVLSGHKFTKFNKRPNFRTQKLENVTMSLRFLEESEGIRIVNIDSTHIVDNHLKLILGLIWTLILHYSISMPVWDDDEGDGHKDATPKQRLLAWVQNKVPDQPVKNFTTDWNDGKAIGALVDSIAPGLCPDWDTWDPKDKVRNATEAMDSAEQWLEVPQLIKPEELCNPKVDELSMMTYLSQFPNAKLKPGAPLRPKTNAARVRAYGPGIEPEGNSVGAPARFVIETFSAGRGDAEVIVLNPRGQQEKCEITFNNDRNLTYTCIYVPTMEGKYKVIVHFAKQEIPKSPFEVNISPPLGDASKVTAAGPGLEKTGNMVCQKTYFEVFTEEAGIGTVDVAVVDPHGHKDTVRPIVTQRSEISWYVEYTPTDEGLHSVNVFFAGKAIPNSPYGVGVSPVGGPMPDPNAIGLGVPVTPMEAARASMPPPPRKGGVPMAKEKPIRPGVAKPAQQQTPMAPKQVPVDSKKCYATGRGIQPRGVRVNDNAVFKVHTQGAGEGELKVKIIVPGGKEEPVRIKKISQFVYECSYCPKTPGNYVISAIYGPGDINKSPFKVEVGPTKTSKIRAYGPGLESGIVGYPANFTVETNGETGALGFSIEGPSQAKIDCKDNGDGSADISYWPTAPGEYAVHILCNEEDIPDAPYMAEITPNMGTFDPNKVIASGSGLEKTGVTVNKWAEFTVDTRAAGKAQLHVAAIDVDYNPVEVFVKDNKDGTYHCRYMPKRNVRHTIIVSYGGVGVPNSPFRVQVQEASNPSKVKVSGPAVERPVKTFEPTYFIVDCSEAGPGDVQIALTNERGLDVPVKTTDHKDNTFRIDFEPQTVGQYNASVFFADQEIPSSPYRVNAQPSVDVSKVHIDGLDNSVFLESTTDFTVDATSVTPTGEGKVKAFVTAPSGTRMETLVNNNNDGTYKCMYTPFEQGPHKIDVTYEGLQVPKSPFPVNVVPGCDPNRVKAFGPGLEGGYTNTPQVFTVETRGAGQGGLGLAIEGPSEAKMTCRDNRDGSCTVEYYPTKKGDYDINVKFSDKDIPGSPFQVKIQDEINPAKVMCTGAGLEPSGVRAGQPAPFVVDASEAGEALLECSVTDQAGQRHPVEITPRSDEEMYDCLYHPESEGNVKVEVRYANQHVPGSPFQTRIMPGHDASKVKVTGDGVKSTGVLASIPVSFTIDTREAGDADLDVVIQDPAGNYVRPKIQDNGDGTYTVTYTPDDVGRYSIGVKFGGQNVPGAPFSVRTKPTGDASKVKIADGLRTTIPIGEECVINVNAAEAGYGNVTCRIHSNATSDVDIDIVDNGDGTVSIMYTPRVPGAYTLNIKFGGQPVPNGEITQQAVAPEEYMEILEQERLAQEQDADEEMIQKQDGGRVHGARAPVNGADFRRNGSKDSPDGVGEVNGLLRDMYHPVDFCIPVGPIFTLVEATITTPSGARKHPEVVDNKDGTVSIRFQPEEVGLHYLDVSYNGQPINGSPFEFYVSPAQTGAVYAYGPGLSHGVAGHPSSFTIVTRDAGAGGLSLAIEGPSKAEIECVDNKDGTCSATYVPTAPGEYQIVIKFADQLIAGAPFTAKITSPTGADRQRAQVSVGTSSEISLKVTESDISSLTATIRSPSGHEEPCVLKRLANGHLGISFTPHEVGEHLVNVYRNGTHIPNSPFKIFVGESEIGNASKVKVYGKGLSEGLANEPNEFFVNTKDAGYSGLSLSIEGPSKADIECRDNEDGSCKVTYKPTEPGNYIVNVKFAGEHVPGSPFLVKIGGEPSGRLTERIMRQREAADITQVGSQCELSLAIPGTSLYDMDAMVASPSGVTEMCEIQEVDECQYSIKFVPKEMGVHTVSVKHRGMHIPGSPFQFTVGPITDGGAHKVRAIGPGLERGEVDKPCHFNIYTREAGAGGLSISIEGPSKAEIDFHDRKDGSCGVSYTCTEPGEYLASIKFNDQHIPDSPFKVHIAPSTGDSRKLQVQNLQDQQLQINKPAAFTVDFHGARGQLDARVVAPSGAEDEAIVQEVDKDRYAVRFIPRENGMHYIHVRLNGNHIAGSPFRVMVGKQDADASLVRAYGDGLSRGKTSEQCKFIVNTQNAGSGALAVTVDGPSKVQLNCREIEEGYEFTYTPSAPGDYLITIKYAGNTHIPGSPFKATITGPGQVHPGAWTEQSQVVVETVTKSTTTQKYAALQQRADSRASDANKVMTRGAGLKKAFANKEQTFQVDASNAGNNMLLVGVWGPETPCEEVIVKHMGRRIYNVNYKVRERGDYVIIVKYGDDHVPGSPFSLGVS